VLRLGFLNGAPRRWELQYGGALAFHEARHQHDLAARKFQGVMVHVPLIFIHLAEARDACRNRPAAIAKQVIEFNVALERKLCAGKQTHGNTRLIRGRKAARDRFAKARRYERFADRRRPGRNVLQAIIAHGHLLFLTTPGR
jgi:hypothetical protein